MQVVGKSERQRSSRYTALLIQAKQDQITYHSRGKLTLIIIPLCFSTFYFGYCLTYFSSFGNQVTLDVFGELAIQTVFNSVLLAVPSVGALVGAAVAPFLMRALSRKQLLLVINLCAIVIQGIIQVPNVYAFLVCKIFQGLFTGIYMALIPIYVGELAPIQIKGSFGVLSQLFIIVGQVLGYAFGLIFDAADLQSDLFYRLMCVLNTPFIIVQTILLLANVIPQSPNSLLIKNKTQQARKVIGMFTLQKHIQRTLRQKQKQVQYQLSSRNQQTKTTIQYSWKAYLIGFQLPLMQQMVGINSVVVQANQIVKNIIPGLVQYAGLILVLVTMVGSICSVFIIARIGRKPLMLIGNLGLAIIDIIVAILFLLDGNSDNQGQGYAIFVLLIIYMVLFGLTIGPGVWLYVPQIVPAKVVPFATMLNWLGSTICVVCTPIALQANGSNPYPVFFFFGGLSLVFFVMNALWMVQTKNKSSAEIAQSFFGKKKQ